VLDTVCSDWPVPRAVLPSDYTAKGAAPILVIGTSNDPATPYSGAQSLAAQLQSGVLVSYRGEGHTVYNKGVACIDDAVEDYFLKGLVPTVDPMC
jgi:pimeloyl-ACP methyl ester carboxylesterase